MANRMKLTPKRFELIVKMLSRGHYLTTAAKTAGISSATLAVWRKRGRDDGDGIYFEFAQAVDDAHAKGEVTLVDHVISAVAKGEWRAATWILERKYGERWAKKSEIALTGQGGGPVQVQPVSHDKVLAAYAKRLNATKAEDLIDIKAEWVDSNDPMCD